MDTTQLNATITKPTNSEPQNNNNVAKNQNNVVNKSNQKNKGEHKTPTTKNNNINSNGNKQINKTANNSLNMNKANTNNKNKTVLNLDENKDKKVFVTDFLENSNQVNTNNNAQQNKKITRNKNVKITFLGGVGEIGKNMTAIEYDNEIIIIDAGLSFPGDDLPGVDLVVPDITFLKNNKEKVKAIVLTHGHEDHIGGLPFVLSDLNVPIYGTALTLGLVQNKLREFSKIKYKAITVKAKQVLRLGQFTVEFIHVNHSIAGALALFITTPAGNIFHTGDFKIDFFPVDGDVTDMQRIGELGKRGIDLLLCESTNVGRAGYSISESQVGKALGNIFERHNKDRLFVATFASNIHRIQQLIDLADKYKRKVVFTGRSMINVSEVALKLGELKFDKNILIDVDKIDKYAPHELLILTTGSQGEAMSALSRMASGQFPKINIGKGDTVIFSSSPIPGNEKSVYSTINRLFQRGANVIYDELEKVHASGHAFQEEIKIMHALTKPKFFMPVHGEYRHLKIHKELAIAMGTPERNILLPELGLVVEFNKNTFKTAGYVQAGQRLIDGIGIGDMDSTVLKDRMQLSEDGICVAVLNVSAMSGKFSSDPFTITRGVVYQDEADQFHSDVKAHLLQLLKDQDLRSMEMNLIRNNVRRALSNFIFKRTKRRPMILVIVMFD
jgi:ribonuclease J